MSIASELVSTEENIVKAYDSLNKLGETATDKNIQNISELVDNIYNKFPKTPYVEGSNITIDNSLKGKLNFEDDKVGYGDIEQESTQGYQLLPFSNPNTSGSSNGIEWELQEDGGIKIKGTSTAQVVINYTRGMEKTLTAGTYMLSSTNFITNARFQIWYSTATLLEEIGQSARSITINEDTTFQNFRSQIVIPNGNTIDAVVYVQLEKGNTIHDFEKYTGGQASPNPSYPQEIEVVRGKNRFDKDSLTIEMGTINTDGSFADSTIRARAYNLDLVSNTTYTISSSNSNLNVVPYYYNSNDTFISYDNGWKTLPYTFTMPSNATRLKLLFRNGSTNTISLSELTNIQLEEGTQATPYLPYNTLEEVVSGKNMFDIGTSLDDYFQTSTNGTKIGNTSVNVATATISNNKLTIDSYNSSGYNWISKWLNLEKNTNYVISGTNDSAIKIVGFTSNELQTTGTEIITKNTSDVSKTFNSGDYKYYCLSFYPSATGKYFENIQIEEGSSATPYEPYITPTSYQLSLGDIELYEDSFIDRDENGEWYFNDNWKVNSQTLTFGNLGSTSPDIYYTQAITDYATSDNIPVCNYFGGITNVGSGGAFYTLTTNKDNVCGFINVSGSTTPRLYLKCTTMNATQINSFFANNNVKLVYKVAETIRTKITDETLISQLNAWYNAQSNNGTTIITSNGELPLVIKVRALKGE